MVAREKHVVAHWRDQTVIILNPVVSILITNVFG